MLHNAPLDKPADVAWFLASYARDAKARIEGEGLGALKVIRDALEEALGVKFEGEKGERFFRSTLVQTLFYGVFSAWVLWHKQNPKKKEFDWYSSARYLRVPILRKLFHLISEPGQMDELQLSETLDWAATVLNRVNRATFFASFNEGEAVQYFYEPFLEAFDPQLRKELGIWYTPSEIVQYMVARVDTVLRTELGIADGLADERVYVLDPCCGTVAYLVEVLKRIHQTLQERGGDALSANDLKKAATERVFGFEILPAPFVVAHLQLGLLLQTLDAPLADKAHERAQVYLTNALTGWEPPKGPKKQFLWKEMEEEREAAEGIKRDKPILVVLSNPPYNAFAGISPEEEHGLVEPYKAGLISKWKIKKFNLDDLYVRFFRLAERRIAEKTGKGVICYISNYSYLSDPSYVVMRQRFLSEFDQVWIDCLNGDSRETGKLTPEGKPDPSAFSTEANREGIKLGTTIGLLIRHEQRNSQTQVYARQFWGVNKRSELLESLKAEDFNAQYELATPTESNRFSLRNSDVAAHYLSWPKLVDLCDETPISGLQEMRKGGLMDINKEVLESRMKMYFDPKVAWETLASLETGLTENGGGFTAATVREKAQVKATFNVNNLTRYSLYPFDNRWCYYSNVSLLWNRPRPNLMSQKWPGNQFIITRMVAERPNEHVTITATSALPDYHLLRPNAVAIPVRLRSLPQTKPEESNAQGLPFGDGELIKANLSSSARSYLRSLGIQNPDDDSETAGLIWMHALAIGYSPAYLQENADGIKQDWPRIPLPATREALLASAELGRQIAALLDTETPVSGVTAGPLRPELRAIADITRVGGGKLHPEDGDLNVTVGWGHGGKGGITMPGKGKLVLREVTPEESFVVPPSGGRLGDANTPPEGGTTNARATNVMTCDVYLNNVAYWRNVPERVWGYTIGGYQVMKKWLSYREQPLLGRGLKPEEAREVTQMARRIAAILLLEPQLDANYQAVKATSYKWT